MARERGRGEHRYRPLSVSSSHDSVPPKTQGVDERMARERGRGEHRYRPLSTSSPSDTVHFKRPRLNVSSASLKESSPPRRRKRSRFSAAPAAIQAEDITRAVAQEKEPKVPLPIAKRKDESVGEKTLIDLIKLGRGRRKDGRMTEASVGDFGGGLFDSDAGGEGDVEMAAANMVRGSRPSPLMDGNGRLPAENSDSSVRAIHGEEVDPLDSYMVGIKHKAKEAAHQVGFSLANTVLGSDEEEEEEKLASVGDNTREQQDFLSRIRKKKLVYEKVDHSQIDYPPFKKDLYIEVPEISRMTFEDVVALRKTMGGMRIRGKRCPKPVFSFSQCGIPSAILSILKALNFVAPTPIQAQAIPAVMSGRDVIGVAKTGSGKTLAYLLPALRHVAMQDRVSPGEGPIALIIAPTRELALQIYGESKRFGKAIGIRSTCVYGGSSIASQISDLKRGVEIVICTPGRMIDLLAMNGGRVTNLRRCTFVVLDEADRMFDLGFAPQLTRLVENVRPDRQTTLFSATFPAPVEALARKVLKQPVEITAGGNSIPAGSIRQFVEVRSESSKFHRLLSLLGEYHSKGSILVFVDRQENADRIYTLLQKAGYKCLPLHGGMDQLDRDSALADFKASLVQVLVATSIAARGLDVKHLNLVVNYDVPNHYEDYVHRIGRTGRAGRSGTAYTFITPDQGVFAAKLVKALEISNKLASQQGAGGSEGEKAFIVDVPPELRKLADSFEEKRRRGEVKHAASSGYGGKGFKFTADEENKNADIRRLQAKEYRARAGNADDDSDLPYESKEDGNSASEKEDDDVVVREISRESRTTQHGLSSARQNLKGGLGVSAKPMSEEDVKTMLRNAVAAEEAAARAEGLGAEETARRVATAKAKVLSIAAARSKAGAQQSLGASVAAQNVPVLPGTASSLLAADAASAAAKAAAAISAKLGVDMGMTSNVNTGIDDQTHDDLEDLKKKFAAELEINDYPQHARWRVTHKNSLADVEEFTECVVTTKGNHYPMGRNPPAGERKLYLLIEGPDVASVRTAAREIKRKLEEASASRPDGKGAYSKYSVI